MNRAVKTIPAGGMAHEKVKRGAEKLDGDIPVALRGEAKYGLFFWRIEAGRDEVIWHVFPEYFLEGSDGVFLEGEF